MAIPVVSLGLLIWVKSQASWWSVIMRKGVVVVKEGFGLQWDRLDVCMA